MYDWHLALKILMHIIPEILLMYFYPSFRYRARDQG